MELQAHKADLVRELALVRTQEFRHLTYIVGDGGQLADRRRIVADADDQGSLPASWPRTLNGLPCSCRNLNQEYPATLTPAARYKDASREMPRLRATSCNRGSIAPNP